MNRTADKYDITAVADLIARRIVSGLHSGRAYTRDDARRTNEGEGWTYEVRRRETRTIERVEAMRLSDAELTRAWETANRRVDNDDDLYYGRV